MATGFRKNVPPRFASYSDSDALGDSSEQGTPASSDVGNLVPITAFVRYTEEDLWIMTSFAWIRSSRLKPVIPNPQANKKCENHFNTYGRRYLFQPYPVRIHILCNRISFHRHQFKHQKNQAIEDLLPWIEFKVSLRKSLGDSKASVYTTWSLIR